MLGCEPEPNQEQDSAAIASDGFIHHPGGSVTVPPLPPGEFPSSLERMRIEVSKAWRALGYSPSTHWVERWILHDLHHAQDFLDGKLFYPRNPEEFEANP